MIPKDILALEELSRQLFMEIHDMQNMRERIEWSKTCQGKYFNFLGYFFSLYCTWKIFISTVNIVFDRVGRVDPITKSMEIAVHWFGLDIDVLFWYEFPTCFVGKVTAKVTRDRRRGHSDINTLNIEIIRLPPKTEITVRDEKG